MTALRRYPVAGMEIVHSGEFRAQAARRDYHIHKVREILLDLFRGLTGSMLVHLLNFDENQIAVVDLDQRAPHEMAKLQ